MIPQRITIGLVFLLAGCASFTNASLSAMVSISNSSNSGVALLMKFDAVKQLEFRAKAKIAKSNAELDALEAERNAYMTKRDKALLTFDKLNLAIDTLEKGFKAGTKLDLAAAYAAYKDLKILLEDIGVKLPEAMP